MYWLGVTDDEGGSSIDKRAGTKKPKAKDTTLDIETAPTTNPEVVISSPNVLASSLHTDTTQVGTHVSWIYNLSKSQLQAELGKRGLPVEGTSKELRTELARAVRSMTPSPLENVHQFRGPGISEIEAISIREILGLPPDANFSEIRHTLTAVMQRPTVKRPETFGLDYGVGVEDTLRDPNDVSRQANQQTNLDTASLCNTVRKWNLRFDGKRDSDAISFLERLKELIEAYGLTPDSIIKALPELLRDTALLWYRNNRDFWNNFGDFLRDFQMQYLPPGYLLQLDDEIRRRTQGDGEMFRQYVVAISTLLRRRGGVTEVEKLERIFANMHPNYKMYIRRRDFVSLPGLMKLGEEFEAYQRDERTSAPHHLLLKR